MATTTSASARLSASQLATRPLGIFATASVLVVAGLAVAVEYPAGSPLVALVAMGVLALAAWMFFNERYELSLAMLMLYIGLADGYLKLRTGSSQVTLVRDLLLYSIAAGVLIRAAVRRQPLDLPPLSGWVIAWVVVVAVQIFNPNAGTLSHSLASVRPHVEWVPLFFLGYFTIRSKARLRNFLLLLLVVAAANGIMGLIQFNLTPDQLAGWGPGYQRVIGGTGDVSARRFVDEEGTSRTRPFGLGGDMGFAGIVGMIAVPAALALLTLSRRRGVRPAAVLLSIGVVLAVATSQARVAVLGAVIALFAFAALTVTSRAGLRTVLAIGVTVAVAYGSITVLASDSQQGSFDRYSSISNPGEALSTAFNYRRETFAKVPTYARDFPLGAGIGSAGPAASVGGPPVHRPLNAESEPTYLLIELGVPGLAVMLGLNLALFYLSITRIRRIPDRELRILLTGIAAPLFAVFSTWWVGVGTATVPGAPYLWFAAGVLAFWLLEGRFIPARQEALGRQ
jgi:hypothetical protein